LVKNNNVNKTALTKFSVATAVMLVGGLAVVVIPAATTTAYADATTCVSLPILFEACHTVGKNPESCVTFLGASECEDEDDGLSNKDTGKFTGNARRNCAHAEAFECTVEGGPPER
jgi:hypothetical protein